MKYETYETVFKKCHACVSTVYLDDSTNCNRDISKGRGPLSTNLLVGVDQRRGEVVRDEPLLSLHDDVAGRVMLCAGVGRPHGGDRARLELHCAVELEQGLLVASFSDNLEATEAVFLWRFNNLVIICLEMNKYTSRD